MDALTLYIDGIAFWAPALPGWPLARAVLRGEATAQDPPAARPAPPLLAANERRRAPDSVLLALEVASRAWVESGHDAGATASVFTSAHGDLAITDALCQTLAGDPLLLSPTRFHHSVHNAASGYWAIAAGSRAASTALAAYGHSFGAGLLEAACQVAADDAPVLLVGSDTAACGALASVNRSRGLLAVALLLSPTRSTASLWSLAWSLDGGTTAPLAPPALRTAAAQALAGNAMAEALPLFEALAAEQPITLALRVSAARHLALHLQPLGQAPAKA